MDGKIDNVRTYYRGWVYSGQINGVHHPYIYIDEWFLAYEITGALHELRNLRRWHEFRKADELREELRGMGVEIEMVPHKPGGFRIRLYKRGWMYVLPPDIAMRRRGFHHRYECENQ